MAEALRLPRASSRAVSSRLSVCISPRCESELHRAGGEDRPDSHLVSCVFLRGWEWDHGLSDPVYKLGGLLIKHI